LVKSKNNLNFEFLIFTYLEISVIIAIMLIAAKNQASLKIKNSLGA